MPDEGTNLADRPLPCPACAGRLYPRELACADCGLTVKTSYATNEFVGLDEDSLHLLRIFVTCEGRIRDMEAALGVSYPTVKARLAALRETLGFAEGGAATAAEASETPEPPTPPIPPPPPEPPVPPAAAASPAAASAAVDGPPEPPPAPDVDAVDASVQGSVEAVLSALERGEIDFETAMQRIKGTDHA